MKYQDKKLDKHLYYRFHQENPTEIGFPRLSIFNLYTAEKDFQCERPLRKKGTCITSIGIFACFSTQIEQKQLYSINRNLRVNTFLITHPDASRFNSTEFGIGIVTVCI